MQNETVSDIFQVVFEVLMVAFPTAGIFLAGSKLVRPPRTWREQASIAAVVLVSCDLVIYATFLLWPFFGAKAGSGVARWEHTLNVISVGFWVSVIALLLALVAVGKVVRRLLLLLSIAGVFFWFVMRIPVGDFLAVERAKEAASHASP